MAFVYCLPIMNYHTDQFEQSIVGFEWLLRSVFLEVEAVGVSGLFGDFGVWLELEPLEVDHEVVGHFVNWFCDVGAGALVSLGCAGLTGIFVLFGEFFFGEVLVERFHDGLCDGQADVVEGLVAFADGFALYAADFDDLEAGEKFIDDTGIIKSIGLPEFLSWLRIELEFHLLFFSLLANHFLEKIFFFLKGLEQVKKKFMGVLHVIGKFGLHEILEVARIVGALLEGEKHLLDEVRHDGSEVRAWVNFGELVADFGSEELDMFCEFFDWEEELEAGVQVAPVDGVAEAKYVRIFIFRFFVFFV